MRARSFAQCRCCFPVFLIFNCFRFRAAAHAAASYDEAENSWDSDDSVCLMEDVDKAKAREMVLLKSIRMKPKLGRMGEESLLSSKDSATMKSKRWVKEREAQLQRDQSDVPVRFKEIKNAGFTHHRWCHSLPPNTFHCSYHVSSGNGMSIEWKNPLTRMHQPKSDKRAVLRTCPSLQSISAAVFVEDKLPQPESGAICRLPILKHMYGRFFPPSYFRLLAITNCSSHTFFLTCPTFFPPKLKQSRPPFLHPLCTNTTSNRINLLMALPIPSKQAMTQSGASGC